MRTSRPPIRQRPAPTDRRPPSPRARRPNTRRRWARPALRPVAAARSADAVGGRREGGGEGTASGPAPCDGRLDVVLAAVRDEVENLAPLLRAHRAPPLVEDAAADDEPPALFPVAGEAVLRSERDGRRDSTACGSPLEKKAAADEGAGAHPLRGGARFLERGREDEGGERNVPGEGDEARVPAARDDPEHADASQPWRVLFCSGSAEPRRRWEPAPGPARLRRSHAGAVAGELRPPTRRQSEANEIACRRVSTLGP